MTPHRWRAHPQNRNPPHHEERYMSADNVIVDEVRERLERDPRLPTQAK
jgi:hypothetical protein